MPRPIQPLPAILLAAGRSSRMHAFKPLLPLGPHPILLHAVHALLDSHAVRPLLVVIGHRASELAEALSCFPVTLITNPAYAEGEMLSSIQAALSSLPSNAPALLVALGDQPAISPATIDALVRAWHDLPTPPALILPTHHGKRGHPLLLSAALLPELLALNPRTDTLKTLIHRHLSSAHLVEVDDPAILQDLDTPDDLRAAQQQYRPQLTT